MISCTTYCFSPLFLYLKKLQFTISTIQQSIELISYKFRYSILDLILRAIEALSVIDDHSQEICSSKELFELASGLVKFSDKFEVEYTIAVAYAVTIYALYLTSIVILFMLHINNLVSGVL